MSRNSYAVAIEWLNNMKITRKIFIALTWICLSGVSFGYSYEPSEVASPIQTSCTASGMTRAFFINWNRGDREKAKDILITCIHILKNHMDGAKCYDRFEDFLQLVNKGKIDGMKFTETDINHCVGISSYLMEPVWAAMRQQHQAFMAQQDAIMGAMSASISAYQKEGELSGYLAKQYARSEFERCYQTSFRLDRRPNEEGEMRDAWDACKRVYDIFTD